MASEVRRSRSLPPAPDSWHRHAPRLYFEQRLRVLDSLGEQLQSFVAAFFLHLGQGFVKYPSAVLRLPCHIIELMNFVTRFEP